MTKERLNYILEDIKNKEQALIEEYNMLRVKMCGYMLDDEYPTEIVRRMGDNLRSRQALLKQYRQAYKDYLNIKK